MVYVDVFETDVYEVCNVSEDRKLEKRKDLDCRIREY